MRKVLILSILGLLAVSCYEKQEGCLDFRANNYDFSADEPCDDCCTFPKMVVGVEHRWGDTLLLTDSIYSNLAQQSIRIIETKFFLSDIALTKAGERTSVVETVTVVDASGNESEINAGVALVGSKRFTYTLGTFDKAEVFDGISFNLGIDGTYSADELNTDATVFNEETLTYTNFQMAYVADQVSQDTLFFELVGRDFVSSQQINGKLR